MPSISTLRALAAIAVLAIANIGFAGADSAADPLDWPFWRGPEMNGISRETGIVDSWSPKGENLLWKRDDMGSRSTPIVLRGKLYFLTRHKPGTPEEAEKVVCLDAATGETVWENVFNTYLTDVPDTRVAWSSVVGDPTTGNIFALGVNGYFQCINGDNGQTIWSHSMNEEYGLLSTYGGRTNFPVLFENEVIISAVMIGWGDLARPVHRFLAFDKETGVALWSSGTRPLPDDTTYSTPIPTVLKGQAALVFASGDGGVYAFQTRTGKQIWNYFFSRRGINSTPLILGDNILIGQSEENIEDNSMGAFALIDGTQTGDITGKHIWRNNGVMVGKSAPVVVGERVYAVDDGGIPFEFDLKTGKPVKFSAKKEKLGTMYRASLLYADGKLFSLEANGKWCIMKIDGDTLTFTNKLRLPGEGHASPIISHGRLYVMTTEGLWCIGQKDKKPTATDRPPTPQEDPIGSNTKPAQVQIVPVEVLLKPGETQKFEVRLFNDRGQYLGVAENVEYSLAAPSEPKPGAPPTAPPIPGKMVSPDEIGKDGVLKTVVDSNHRGLMITAKVGDLTSVGRARVVPPLPWKFDFSDGSVPVTWVGARYRHQPREVDGEKMIVKITTIPKGTRSQAWMGHPDFHDYTIQADLKGSIKDGKMPDMGLIAQRYTVDMMGASQQLQIRTWPPVLQMGKTIPFTWKPDTWYTVKFRAANEGDKAVLKAKVWERSQSEPPSWTIETEGVSPNKTGSPGLFGNATNAEVFIDNVSVTPNS